MQRPTPLNDAREFRINEMFFSTTDRRGVIQSGNSVFVRVSGYTHDQLVGAPHNIIRHPSMPRAVFRLVWGYLKRDQPVAGLVKNLASDGRHYWVVAFLMPIRAGYLSIRFKPSSELVPVVEDLYGQMGRVEKDTPAGGDAKAGMQAAEALLQTALRARGFADYDEFMRVLLHDELKSRDQAIAAQRSRLFPAALDALAEQTPLHRVLTSIYTSGLRSYDQINALYAELDQFAALNQRLADKSVFVLGLAKDFRFIAFNAALRSSRLGEEGRSLSVIAEYLSGCSTRTTSVVDALTEEIGAISKRLRRVIFDLAAARLQIEMILVFCAELAAAGAASRSTGERKRMIEDLQGAFASTVSRAVEALEMLTKELRALGATAEDMRRLVLTLQVAQVGGLVEASRLKNDDTFAAMFDDLRDGVGKTKEALHEVDEASEQLATLADHAPTIAATVGHAVAEMARAIQSLAENTGLEETAAASAGASRDEKVDESATVVA